MEERHRHFEEVLWPHLRGAYNVARWLSGNDQDAEDIVQESFTKAFQAADGFRGGDARSWLLAIVRNTALNFIQRRRPKLEVEWSDKVAEPADRTPGAEVQLIEQTRRNRVRSAIEQLPNEFREALVLREIEGLSYKEIAAVLKAPLGTVMSRLSRARALLMQELIAEKGARI